MIAGPATPAVLAARAGDHRAFAQLVDDYRNVVCSITLAVVRDVQASEDLAQEVFLAAWVGLRRLRSPQSFLPWLRQLARNRAHEFVRGRVRWRRRHADWQPPVAEGRADGLPLASDRLIAEEEALALSQAMNELPDEAREIVTLYYREGSSARQVAQLLGLSEDAVKKRLERARTALREAMLARFAEAVKKTAPGAAFTAAVAAALATGAPATASAAALGVGGVGGAGKLLGLLAGASGALAGLGGGLFGIWFGLRFEMRKALDVQERRQLTRLGVRASLLTVVAVAGMFAAGPMANHGHRRAAVAVMMSTYLLFAVGLAVLYGRDLPRIMARRLAAERARDPTAARRQQRTWRLRIAGGLFGLVCGTVGAAAGCWFLLNG
jgi:RNA polymerase sigma factor (sigma-70 family)